MALKKTKTFSNGTSGEYWKITEEKYDRLTKKYIWTISLFKDQSYRMESNGKLGISKQYSFELTSQELAGNRTALGYTKIKAKANEMIEPPFNFPGNPESIPYDSDLANAEDT